MAPLLPDALTQSVFGNDSDKAGGTVTNSCSMLKAALTPAG